MAFAVVNSVDLNRLVDPMAVVVVVVAVIVVVDAEVGNQAKTPEGVRSVVAGIVGDSTSYLQKNQQQAVVGANQKRDFQKSRFHDHCSES